MRPFARDYGYLLEAGGFQTGEKHHQTERCRLNYSWCRPSLPNLFDSVRWKGRLGFSQPVRMCTSLEELGIFIWENPQLVLSLLCLPWLSRHGEVCILV